MQTAELIWALVPWAFANLFVLAVTAAVWRFLRLESRRIDVLVFLFLYIFLTITLVMLCGLAGILRPLPISLLSFVGLVTIGVLARVEIRQGMSRLAAFFEEASLADRTRKYRVELLFVAAFAVLAARIVVHAWYLPPYVWDVLSYHLPKVAEWVQSGALVIFDTPVDRTFWPANFELFQTWFVLFPHHDFLVELAGMPFFVLACVAVYAIARLIGLSRPWGLMAALAYALTPGPLQHVTTGKNDLPIAALYLFLFAVLLDARNGWRHPRRRLVVIFLTLCLALGIKPYIAFLIPGLLVVAVWAARGKSWKELWGEPSSDARFANVATSLLMLAAILLAGYWFLRNAVVFGNPFYPAEPRIFGSYLFDSISPPSSPRGDSVPLGGSKGGGDSGPEGWERQGVVLSGNVLGENLGTLFRQKIFDPEEFHFSMTDSTCWGWFAFVCGWPVLIYGLLASVRIRWLAGAFLASFLALMSSVVPDPWNLRFSQWFPALFALAFAHVVSRLRVPALRHSFIMLAACCLALNFVGTLDIGKLSPWSWLRMRHFPVAERSSASLGLFMGRNYFDALEAIPPDETIGYNTNYNGWIYPLYDADLSRRVRFVPIGVETDVVAMMRKLEVRYLFTSLPETTVRWRLSETVRRGGLRQIGEGLYVLAQ